MGRRTLACVLALASACGGGTSAVTPGADGGSSGAPGAPQGSLPCAVDAVLAQNCRKCHSSPPQYGAPMPMATLADLHAPAKSDPARQVYELVAQRIADDAKPMPPPPNMRLADADRQTLASWAQAGAPASNDSCAAPPPPPSVVPDAACTPDLDLKPASPWAATSGDEYVCYGVDVARPMPTHAVGFVPRVDNTKIVHHILLFQSDSSVDSTPAKCSGGGSFQWRMVSGWAPGAKAFEMPPEAGFPISTDTSGPTHFVVQVHYSNPQGLAGQTDASGFSLCTAPPRPNEADVMAFGTQKITIPAGATYSRTCKVTVASQFAGVHFVAALPHMHKLGTAITTSLTPAAGGAPIDLGTLKPYSFNNQAWVNVLGVAQANDTITTRCDWYNDTTSDVKYGENTSDEMCYSFTVYYPRITTTLWSWAVPAIASSCQ